jgi:hypothetical protein
MPRSLRVDHPVALLHRLGGRWFFSDESGGHERKRGAGDDVPSIRFGSETLTR